MIEKIDRTKSIPFGNNLRFDLFKYILKIKYANEWQVLPKLEGIVELNNIQISTTLDDILFDTGNAANYCVIPSCYYKSFKTLFKQIEFINHTPYTKKSKEMINFRFNDMVEFNTSIVFLSKIYDNWLNSINFGIDVFFQFISIIYPSNSDKNKNRFFCYHHKCKKS